MVDKLDRRRTHSLLLLQKLLTPKPTVSPFTLIKDSLEQSSRPLVAEIIRRAKASQITVVFLSFEDHEQPLGTHAFVRGRGKPLRVLSKEVTSCLLDAQSSLVVIDTLHPLISLANSSSSNVPLAALLTSFTTPNTSLLATYHMDVPLPSLSSSGNTYSPSPMTLLNFLATTLITVQAFSHALAAHRALARSLPVPSFGLEEDIEGVVVGLGANGGERSLAQATAGLEVAPEMTQGIVLEIEYRRKSGRGIGEVYFLPLQSTNTLKTINGPGKPILLDDHPLFMPPKDDEENSEDPIKEAGTFNLSLTDKQRKDRDGVVLPYYDAQRSGDGPGEGGRILYQMGIEDAGDWDSEEDEL